MHEMKIHLIFPIGKDKSITGIGYLALSQPFVKIRECAENGSSRNIVIPNTNISHIEILREVGAKEEYREAKLSTQSRALMAGVTVEAFGDDCIDEDELVAVNRR